MTVLLYIGTGFVALIGMVIAMLCVIGVLAWGSELLILPILKRVPNIFGTILAWIGKLIVWGFGLTILLVATYQLGKDIWR